MNNKMRELALLVRSSSNEILELLNTLKPESQPVTTLYNKIRDDLEHELISEHLQRLTDKYLLEGKQFTPDEWDEYNNHVDAIAHLFTNHVNDTFDTQFIINKHGCYFMVSQAIDTDLLKDCKLYLSLNIMYATVADERGVQIEEVTGLHFEIKNDCSYNDASDCDFIGANVEHYISEYSE